MTVHSFSTQYNSCLQKKNIIAQMCLSEDKGPDTTKNCAAVYQILTRSPRAVMLSWWQCYEVFSVIAYKHSKLGQTDLVSEFISRSIQAELQVSKCIGYVCATIVNTHTHTVMHRQ